MFLEVPFTFCSIMSINTLIIFLSANLDKRPHINFLSSHSLPQSSQLNFSILPNEDILCYSLTRKSREEMAEAIVKLALEKVTDALANEVIHLRGVEQQVEKVRFELDWIRVFLEDADEKQIQDKMQKQWVKEVREVAYWIEDTIDTFLCEIPPKMLGKRAAIKRMFAQIKKVCVIHKLGDEINRILTRLQEINDKKVRYGINSLGESSGEVKRLPLKPPVLPDIEEANIVGFDDDIKNIKQLLVEGTRTRGVVSIVGQGGLGKTTLAKKVYNSYEVQRTFEIRIWVSISQEFEPTEVSRQIFEKLKKPKKGQNVDSLKNENHLNEIYQTLKDKRYLIIIDDVWKSNIWTAINKALPDDNNGSRILMTTRFDEVARDADLSREPYQLEFLTEEFSLELFHKKAGLNQNTQDKNLLDLAKQFVKKCGNLPLALVVLGGLLAKKQLTYIAWNNVMQTMSWHVDDSRVCTEIISTSYADLPLTLKSCFMYFAAFPEDYDINVEPLLQMWIAEGFTPHEENRTLEVTAQSFLEDLAQRSMIQVSKRSLVDNSIERCRIHDLLRDVAIEKAKEDNFLSLCSNRDGEQSCDRARRMAVHNSNSGELMTHGSRNLRTLLCFNSRLPDCSGHKLLKVLSQIKGFPTNMKRLEGLSQLRYLNLSRSIVWDEGYFKKLVASMRFLQTLDLRDLYIAKCKMPDCIWHIKTLRHVMIGEDTFPTPGPPATTDLRNLQTLTGVTSRKSWKKTLPNLSNLRFLNIEIIEGFSWELVVNFLHSLKKLDRLAIKGRDIPTEVVDMRRFPFYHHLLVLKYYNLFCHERRMDFDVAMFPTHLTTLIFQNCKLEQDHLAVLEKLHELKYLRLSDAYPNQTMRCSAGGFPHLRAFFVFFLEELKEWVIEDGAMPMLKDIDIRWCRNLQVPVGLQHLTTLRKFFWLEDPYDSFASKEKEIRNTCKHVPNITMRG